MVFLENDLKVPLRLASHLTNGIKSSHSSLELVAKQKAIVDDQYNTNPSQHILDYGCRENNSPLPCLDVIPVPLEWPAAIRSCCQKELIRLANPSMRIQKDETVKYPQLAPENAVWEPERNPYDNSATIPAIKHLKIGGAPDEKSAIPRTKGKSYTKKNHNPAGKF